jgi:2-polyprenyl-3-methyl-5-hydroxy-6-metoxy-1,4-benzoquinol methylase
MDVRKAYNTWASHYDSDLNKTRDLEAFALKENLENLLFGSCLEVGCGTGKNTEWLLKRASEILAVDLSEEMLKKAKSKISSDKVKFLQANLLDPWSFVTTKFDFIIFSLVLEHIEDLDVVFNKASESVNAGGYVYVGELHPFKQYTGTKARFETAEGLQIVPCFNHNVSDFTGAAKEFGLQIIEMKEFFDDNNPNNIPRILTILFKKCP